MNDAQLHLLLNHFPIIGLIIGTLILLAGIILKSVVSRKIAYVVILVCSIIAIPTLGSGEEAEEILEQMSEMTKERHHLIHEHEEKAELFMPFAWTLIFLSLASIFVEWRKMKFAKYLAIITLVMSLVACYLVREVGNSGGEISHPEIRKDFKLILEDRD